MPQDRREFLKQSSCLAAGTAWSYAALRPSAALASSLVNERISCGMIGVGGRGSYLMNLAMAVPQVEIAALCDVNRQHVSRPAEAVRQKQGGRPKEYHDFRKLLEDKSLHAVIVATPHHWHAPIAIRVLNAEKHVYVEKPASHVFREGRLLLDAARRNRRIVQHGTQMRSSEVTRAAGKALQSGVLGEIKMSKAWGVEPRSHQPETSPDQPPPEYLDWDRWLGPAPQHAYDPHRHQRWNLYREYGNGEIGGDGIHDIDMARWGLGVATHPVRITAQGSRAHVQGLGDFPDNLLATYQYADGKVLIYENRNFAPYKMHGWDNGNIFYGTEGYMIFSRRGYFQTYLGAKEEQGPGLRGGVGNEQHVRNFFDCVRSGESNHADAEVAHLSCGIVHLGEIAYRTGRTIQFDPAKEAILGDEQANAMLTKEYRKPWTVMDA